MAWLRDQLPLLHKCLYANTAASGLLYQDLLSWRSEHDRAFHDGGSQMKMKSFEILPATRETIGQFFNCPPERVALTPNFSLGLNLLLEGLPKDTRVLLVEEDYPSVNWPFESRSFSCAYVKPDAHLETRIHEAILTHGSEVLALSLVQWINGLMLAPEFLKNLKRDYPNLLIIADGTQYCGAMELDFSNSGIDILGTSGYKWLLGGYGNAFFLFSEEAAARVAPKSTGFNSSGGRPDKGKDIPFPLQLEPGHLDSFNFGSLQFSLHALSKIGMPAIAAHNQNLSLRFREKLRGTGLIGPVVEGRDTHSTIFNIGGDRELFDYLTRQGVVCSMRGSGIRLSFHLYNTESEVDRLAELVKNAATSYLFGNKDG